MNEQKRQQGRSIMAVICVILAAVAIFGSAGAPAEKPIPVMANTSP